MRSIKIKSVTKKNDSGFVFRNINLTIPSGEFFALLGPSGCGKTTLLRLICGFDSVESGEIYLGDKNITNFPTNERPINIIFQNYALFPHLNVFNNVAYSLVIRKIDKEEIEAKVIKILKAFHLENLIFKFPSQLSGGQQQRVAVARAIINEPEVLLLDEPLAALDFKLREKMLLELIELQDRLKTTFVYVTHDQFEALTVADHMAIMNHDGEIEQIGTPKEIYEFPNSSFVAKFVGMTNIFTGTLNEMDSSYHLEVPHVGKIKINLDKKRSMQENCKIMMSIRPEKIFISKKIIPNFSNVLKGLVSSIVYHGRSTQYNVIVNDMAKIQVFEQNEEHFPQEDIDYDDEVYLHWQKDNLILLER